MSQDQLDLLIGNSETLLPETKAGAEPLYIWSCWEQEPEGFDKMVRRIAASLFEGRSEAELRDAFLCNGVPRQKTGTPKALDGP